MTDAISPSSSTCNANIDQDNHPMTKDGRINLGNVPSFHKLIEDYNRIKEELMNQLKELAQSCQDNPSQYSVPDIKTSVAFREILKNHNLSEQEGLNLLKKVEEKLQELKLIKV